MPDVQGQKTLPSMNVAHRSRPVKGHVVAGCVADNDERYLDQAERLLASWRWFGGSLATGEFHVCVVEEVPDDYRERYERLGAKVHVVERFDRRHPPSNKLRLLELDEARDADWVLLLDCDTIIVQDPSGLFAAEADLVAKPADFATVPHDIFMSLFEVFDLPLPSQTYRCTVSGEPTVPYFNAGVLAFSRKRTARLVDEWIALNRRLLDHLELLRERRNFCEQASLTLALAACGATVNAVGNAMNFPAHCTDQPVESDFGRTDPIIIHYHWLTDPAGCLLPSPYPKVNERILRFNERWRAECRRWFNNRTYWNRRYRRDPGLGSGLGSRGHVRDYKQELLRATVEMFQPDSILDVGCGDMEVSMALPEGGYLGIDISEEIIARNRSQYPGRRFLCGGLLELDLDPADLVVCLDVCIHMRSAEEYHRFLSRLVSCARKGGVVAGYDSRPPVVSDITFYWEPLSDSLRKAGARNVRPIGAYRQVTVFRFEPPGAAGPAQFRPPQSSTSNGLREPVFIVGPMRSGTTLLAELLGRSPDVGHCPFELKDLWSEITGFPMASAKTRDEICPELAAHHATQDVARRLADVFIQRMKTLENKNANAVFLNKNPHLCNKLSYVQGLFPDARFIWIHRHLPQTVASLKRLFSDVKQRQGTWHWWPEREVNVGNRCWNAVHSENKAAHIPADRLFPGGKVRYLAEYWLETNRAVAEFFARVPPNRRITLSEEALVAEPIGQTVRCLARLCLPYFELEGSPIAIDTTRNEEWKFLLSPRECAELREFVMEQRDAIDAVFAGEQYSALYLKALDEAPIGRDTTWSCTKQSG